MTTQTVLDLLKEGAGQTAAYRRDQEQAAALDQVETDCKIELTASLLLGPEEFVERMKKLLRRDRREQTTLRRAGQGTLRWEAITPALSGVCGQDWETLLARYGSNALGAALYLGRNYSDRTLRELGELAEGCNTPL